MVLVYLRVLCYIESSVWLDTCGIHAKAKQIYYKLLFKYLLNRTRVSIVTSIHRPGVVNSRYLINISWNRANLPDKVLLELHLSV